MEILEREQSSGENAMLEWKKTFYNRPEDHNKSTRREVERGGWESVQAKDQRVDLVQ